VGAVCRDAGEQGVALGARADLRGDFGQAGLPSGENPVVAVGQLVLSAVGK
jgi:hypothetical protein